VTPEDLARLHAAAETHDRPWSAPDFADLLAAPGALLIAEDTACFALARTVADEAELLILATHPDARRRGLARAALAALHRAAAQRGVATVFLEVAADNAAARALYDAAGYAETGRRPAYYRRADGRRVDAILMARHLDPGGDGASAG
jgi:ribosomal-protein-alanine N-acetyltransferase